MGEGERGEGCEEREREERERARGRREREGKREESTTAYTHKQRYSCTEQGFP